ncbi:FAD:protein FMN transferase [Bosea sp. BIWAKO-01]|uniref:FAD:protein FMN transferase n=1 Tax=Bosea sp. BIWAKO-01 TaxID=506668 RepID=UPI000852A545|nr:FAD:protein FMN transferase [Bosea sp. BIWAKO-01]GAU87073.1 nitrous oxide reductase maturation periplasmic protein NosX [Bosea sp. BIWAKO-01]
MDVVTRRRIIGIAAAAGGLALLPLGCPARAEGHLVTWRGQCMGAVASLQIHHHDRAEAERLIAAATAEAVRLERIFSLHRDDSALVRLNRDGVLIAPPPELVALLTDCRRYWALSGGAFDPTVQRLWTLYHRHFARPDADMAGPSPEALREALDTVGFEQVVADPDRLLFRRRGMALTLNGIAQGYVTDRVVALLRAGGIDRSLVDMGEPRVLGPRPDGSPWQIGIADPQDQSRITRVLDVVDGAVATSAGDGFRFDREGRFHHLLDPRNGASPDRYRTVTVAMPTATAADALSTAFSLMPLQDIIRTRRALGTGCVYLTTSAGQTEAIGV